MASYSKKSFISNMFLMSGTMLIIRVIGMVSNIYFTSVVGADSTGMFHIIFSVYGFAVTLSVAGTGLAVTRLVSESGTASGRTCSGIIRKSLIICLTTSVVTASGLWIARDILSKNIFNTPSAAQALMLLSLSLPAVAVSTVMRGYFMASRKIGTLTASQLIEELSSVAITLYLLSHIRHTEYGYMAIICGIALSAFIAAVFDIVMYRLIISHNRLIGSDPIPGYREILSISVPVALGAYLRSALVSLENTMIPGCLAASGVENPLSEYGIVKGMSMPLMLFPTVFISSFANMLVPELADRRAGNKPNGIRYIAENAIKATLYFSFMAAGFFFICHDLLGQSFYHNSRVGIYLGLLALLVIPMYLDTVVDSMLKGLNQQVSSLKYNITDSLLRVIFIRLVIPQKGINAYIFLLYASEFFNLWLSLGRLIKVTKLRLKSEYILKPSFTALTAYITAQFTASGEISASVIFIVSYAVTATALELTHRLLSKR